MRAGSLTIGGFEEATRALSGYIVAGRAGQGTATLDHVGKVCGILGIDLGMLSAIHVAGTKGKGSTSALTERLLRSAGLKTGLFTSPHLVDVRERVRINGRVLDKDTFSRYFWKVHDAVNSAVAEHAVHLHYFHFLTVTIAHTRAHTHTRMRGATYLLHHKHDYAQEQAFHL